LHLHICLPYTERVSGHCSFIITVKISQLGLLTFSTIFDESCGTEEFDSLFFVQSPQKVEISAREKNSSSKFGKLPKVSRWVFKSFLFSVQ
jgi:hypothetical protein